MSILSIKNLEKRFGDNVILQNVSAEVEKGEVISIIGPSGAGKSTLQKILTGVLPDYRGGVRVLGVEMKRRTNAYYERIGVGFEFPNFYEKFTAIENLRCFAGLYAGRPADIMPLLKRVGLEGDADKKVGSFSKLHTHAYQGWWTGHFRHTRQRTAYSPCLRQKMTS